MHWAYRTRYNPDGFDTNDNVQLVAEGIFPNTCFKPASPKVEVNHDTKTIAVASSAYQYQGMCLQVMLPYNQTMDVGMLKNGTYRVVQAGMENDPTRMLGDVRVRTAANSSADDFLYAPVSQAYVESRNGQGMVKITGAFSNSCMRLADVMVSVQPKVVVVQPISQVDDNGVNCRSGNFPYERTVAVQGLKPDTRYLLHVRSLNGNSINTLFDAH